MIVALRKELLLQWRARGQIMAVFVFGAAAGVQGTAAALLPHRLFQRVSPLLQLMIFVAVVGVIAFGIWQGRKETVDAAEKGGAAGYFLASRGLTWWLVGFSLIAANISTEQFVGMSGQAASGQGSRPGVSDWPRARPTASSASAAGTSW